MLAACLGLFDYFLWLFLLLGDAFLFRLVLFFDFVLLSLLTNQRQGPCGGLRSVVWQFRYLMNGRQLWGGFYSLKVRHDHVSKFFICLLLGRFINISEDYV